MEKWVIFIFESRLYFKSTHTDKTVFCLNVCLFYFNAGCKMYAFCGALFGITSMINLLAISIDRYVVITKPLQNIHWSSKRRTTMVIIMVWLYSLAWSLAPIVGWSEFSYKSSSPATELNITEILLFSLHPPAATHIRFSSPASDMSNNIKCFTWCLSSSKIMTPMFFYPSRFLYPRRPDDILYMGLRYIHNCQ